MRDILATMFKLRKYPLLVGAPGCAKTARILAAALVNSMKVVVIRAGLCERIDFSGCMVPIADLGITRQLPFEVIDELKKTKIPTVLFYDDMGQGPSDVQASLMGTFDKNFLSPHVIISGATNRPCDRAGVGSIIEPLKSRFSSTFGIATPAYPESLADGCTLLQNWKAELAQWVEWSLGYGAPSVIRAYHLATTGAHLYDWRTCSDPSLKFPDYRTWQDVIDYWNAGERDLDILGATIGRPTATHFLGFARLESELPSIDDIRRNPSGARVPMSHNAAYLIGTMMIDASEPRDLRNFSQYANRIDRLYSGMLFQGLFIKHKDLMTDVPEWKEWTLKNQDMVLD